MLSLHKAKIPLSSVSNSTDKEKQKSAVNKKLLQEATESLSISTFLSNFMNFEGETPEEQEYLELCRDEFKTNVLKYSAIGTGAIGINNFIFRSRLPRTFQIAGIAFGAITGGIYGTLTSIDFTMKKLESLGPEYQLGKMVQDEIEEFYIDQSHLK